MDLGENLILLTPLEASERFFHGKISYAAMVAAARKKQLPSIRIGKRIFFEINSMENFFKKQLNASMSTSRLVVNGIKKID